MDFQGTPCPQINIHCEFEEKSFFYSYRSKSSTFILMNPKWIINPQKLAPMKENDYTVVWYLSLFAYYYKLNF